MIGRGSESHLWAWPLFIGLLVVGTITGPSARAQTEGPVVTKSSKFYRGGQDAKIVTAENGARVNADFNAFVTKGPWAQVKTWQVAPKIHAITGYGLSNFTFIEGENGLILIDTGCCELDNIIIRKIEEMELEEQTT